MNKKMVALILENAQKIENLRTTVNDTFKRRNDNSQTLQVWHDATKKLHDSYDLLAFPGGLMRGLQLLKEKDASTIDTALAYLYANPHFFRSGYIEQSIARSLKKTPLNSKQLTDLREMFIEHLSISKTMHRREYYALARMVANDTFIKQIKAIIANSKDIDVVHKARYLLMQIQQNSGKLNS